MKKIILMTTIALLFGFKNSFGGMTVAMNLNSFDVNPKTNGKIIVSSNSATTVTATIVLTRGYNALNNTSYDQVDFRYKIVYIKDGVETPLVAETQLTHSNFSSNSGVLSKNTSVVIPAGLVGGVVTIKHKNYVWSTTSGGSKWYPFDRPYYVETGFQTSSAQVLSQQEIEYLQKRGLSTANVKNFGDYYIVENDILINKASMSADTESAPYGRVSTFSDHNINVYVEESFWSNSTWYGGIYSAIREINAIPGSNIKLHLISSSYNSDQRRDVTIKGINDPRLTGPFAAEYPANGRPGKVILVNINSSSSTGFPTSNGNASWNLLHALMHSIGLTNNNLTLNSKDSQGYCDINCLSTQDQSTISQAYPFDSSSPLVPIIAGPSYLSYGGVEVYSVSYASRESNINYKWEVVGVNGKNFYYLDTYNLPSTELPLDGGAGTYSVRCTISNGKYSTVMSERLVTVGN